MPEWTVGVDQRGSRYGYTAFLTAPDGRRHNVSFCVRTAEEAEERARAALPEWSAFYGEKVTA